MVNDHERNLGNFNASQSSLLTNVSGECNDYSEFKVSKNTKELAAGLLEKDHQTRATLDDILKLVWENTSARITLVERKKNHMSTLSTVIIITIIIMK